MARKILHVDASARQAGSVSRELSQHLVDALSDTGIEVTKREIGLSPLPLISETWVGANFTPEEDRSDDGMLGRFEFVGGAPCFSGPRELPRIGGSF